MDEMVLLWLTLLVSLLFNFLLAYWSWRCGVSIQYFLGSMERSSKMTAAKAARLESNVEYFIAYAEQRDGRTDGKRSEHYRSTLQKHVLTQEDTHPLPVVDFRTWVGYPALVAMQASQAVGARQQLAPLPTPTPITNPVNTLHLSPLQPLPLPSRRPIEL